MDNIRANHAVTVLNDGEVLVSGGISWTSEYSSMLDTNEMYDPSRGCWYFGQTFMTVKRSMHTSSLLLDRKVLVTGGYSCAWDLEPEDCVVTNTADIYDSVDDYWLQTGSMQDERQMHTASVLSNGKVLVAGGSNRQHIPWDTCELYDPVIEQWSRTTDMHEARSSHTATVLQDGKVLVVGGDSSTGKTTDGCELYHPLTGNWTKIASMNFARSDHTATLFNNGQVLVAGGLDNGGNPTESCELYNPSTDTWIVVGSMHDRRLSFTASLLPNGKVLVAGGENAPQSFLSSAELYDPLTRNWTKVHDMLFPVAFHTASVLWDGDVLIVGGGSPYGTTDCMLYNSSIKDFTSSDVVEKLPRECQSSMLKNKKVSAVVEDKFKTANNTQRHW